MPYFVHFINEKIIFTLVLIYFTEALCRPSTSPGLILDLVDHCNDCPRIRCDISISYFINNGIAYCLNSLFHGDVNNRSSPVITTNVLQYKEIFHLNHFTRLKGSVLLVSIFYFTSLALFVYIHLFDLSFLKAPIGTIIYSTDVSTSHTHLVTKTCILHCRFNLKINILKNAASNFLF